MKTCQETYDKSEPRTPFLNLFKKDSKGIPRATGPHRVRLIGDRMRKVKNFSGGNIYKIELTVEEKGEQKIYLFPAFAMARDENGRPVKDENSDPAVQKAKSGKAIAHYLTNAFREIPTGEEVILEGVRNKDGNSIINVTWPIPEEDKSVDVEDVPESEPEEDEAPQESPNDDEGNVNVDEIPF